LLDGNRQGGLAVQPVALRLAAGDQRINQRGAWRVGRAPRRATALRRPTTWRQRRASSGRQRRISSWRRRISSWRRRIWGGRRRVSGGRRRWRVSGGRLRRPRVFDGRARRLWVVRWWLLWPRIFRGWLLLWSLVRRAVGAEERHDYSHARAGPSAPSLETRASHRSQMTQRGPGTASAPGPSISRPLKRLQTTGRPWAR
jgi:hypothetical protein